MEQVIFKIKFKQTSLFFKKADIDVSIFVLKLIKLNFDRILMHNHISVVFNSL